MCKSSVRFCLTRSKGLKTEFTLYYFPYAALIINLAMHATQQGV